MDILDTLNRREFVQLGITTGFALAAGEVALGAVTTSAEGLLAENIQIPVSGGKMPGYWALPKREGKFPVVLVIQEIFGIHAYIQDVCRRLAKEGYLAISPYLYFREGDVTKINEIQKIISEVVSKVPQAQVWSDLDATLTFLDGSKVADTGRTAITGFCWGGNVTWTYAHHNPKLKAGVAWYGRLSETAGPPPAKTPIEIAPDLKVPVLGLYGAKDAGIPLASVEKMRMALAQGKSGSNIHVYPEAEHGFHADYRPSYHEASAKDAWSRLLAWFKKNGMQGK